MCHPSAALPSLSVPAGALGLGKVNPASALLGAYTGALSETDAAPQKVKDLINILPV